MEEDQELHQQRMRPSCPPGVHACGLRALQAQRGCFPGT